MEDDYTYHNMKVHDNTIQHMVLTTYLTGHSSEFRGTNCSAAHTRVEVHNINYVPIAQSLKFRDKST